MSNYIISIFPTTKRKKNISKAFCFSKYIDSLFLKKKREIVIGEKTANRKR